MPAQASTILYISDYTEKVVSGDYFVGTAIGYTRLDDSDKIRAKKKIKIKKPTFQSMRSKQKPKRKKKYIRNK